MQPAQVYIGLMSGTSLDGVDAVAARFTDAVPVQAIGHAHRPMPAALRRELLALNAPGHDELHRTALAANALAAEYALAVDAVLAASGCSAAQIRALGAHGQTVRHRPGEFDGTGYTVQVLNGALLAERSGIDVVCDLRSRDVAAGGQGAPLVPAFHAACFGTRGRTTAVLNLGGIANLSVLHGNGELSGFDCGPGNVLLDLWCQRHLGLDFDRAGAWAAGGDVDQVWLQHLLAEPYFRRDPPKSTGRDLFDSRWLEARLAGGAHPAPQQPRDVQATLAELTATTVADAVCHHAADARRLLVCGGGAFNTDLLRRLADKLPGVAIGTTDAEGLPPMQVEACAFAWLARCHVERVPGNRPRVTGAHGPRILGALYPAR